MRRQILVFFMLTMLPKTGIRSTDTNVAVLTCAFSHTIPARLLFRTGTKNRSRLVDMTAIGRHLGEKACSALIGLHSFTGCNSTSAFAGIGKAGGFKLIIGNSPCSNAAQAAMDGLGHSFDMADQSSLQAGNLHLHALRQESRHFTSINEMS